MTIHARALKISEGGDSRQIYESVKKFLTEVGGDAVRPLHFPISGRDCSHPLAERMGFYMGQVFIADGGTETYVVMNALAVDGTSRIEVTGTHERALEHVLERIKEEPLADIDESRITPAFDYSING